MTCINLNRLQKKTLEIFPGYLLSTNMHILYIVQNEIIVLYVAILFSVDIFVSNFPLLIELISL